MVFLEVMSDTFVGELIGAIEEAGDQHEKRVGGLGAIATREAKHRGIPLKGNFF